MNDIRVLTEGVTNLVYDPTGDETKAVDRRGDREDR